MKLLLRYDSLGMRLACAYLTVTRRFFGGLEHARMGDRTDTHVWFYPFRVYVK